jgi:hypothetical protein
MRVKIMRKGLFLKVEQNFQHKQKSAKEESRLIALQLQSKLNAEGIESVLTEKDGLYRVKVM